MNRFHHTFIYTLLLCPLAAFAADRTVSADEAIAADSVSIFAQADTAVVERKSAPTGFNSLDFLMENRYFNHGETFNKRWDDHLFLEAGVSMEQVMPIMDEFKFTSATMGKIGLGKQFDKYNSLRVSGTAGYVYQRGVNHYQMRVGGRLEHLFDVSSYINGYNPSRRLSVSTILGVGGMYSRFITNQGAAFARGKSLEGHAGIQLRVLAGSQGALNFEPYIGMASDPYDASETRNWRKYDGFYGANLTYTYYFRNNYSPESRLRIIENRLRPEEMTADSVLFSWRTPFFIEASNSIKASTDGLSSPFDHMGNGFTISLGQWFSPAVGVRLSVASENATSHEYLEKAKDMNGGKADKNTRYFISNYKFARAEGLFNPFGLNHYYDWNSQFGMYVLAGLQYGYISMPVEEGNDWIRKRTHGYSAGVHLFTKLSKDLQFFIEPRFEHNSYHLPYWPSHADVRFTREKDDAVTLNFGITVNTCPRKYNYWDKTKSYDDFFDFKHFAIGGGWGLNTFQKRSNYGGSGRLGWNMNGYIEYFMNEYHGFHVSVDYVDHPNRYMKSRGEMKNINHEVFLGAFDYIFNVTNLFSPAHIGRRSIEAYLFAGPAIVVGVNNAYIQTPKLTGNFGAKILYKCTDNIAIHFTPSFYKISGEMMDYIFYTTPVHDWQFFQTLNVGVQYSF